MKEKKKINIAKKPERTKVNAMEMVDDWVQAKPKDLKAKSPVPVTVKFAEEVQKPEKARFKRFTLDVPIDLHTRIKVYCAERELNMSDEIRRLLKQEFLR